MKTLHVVAAGLLAAITGIPGGVAAQATPTGSAPTTPAQMAAADHGIPPYTKADVAFMQGMIHHHAQAVVMGGWATSHGARPDVAVLCARIVVAQTDEVNMMKG